MDLEKEKREYEKVLAIIKNIECGNIWYCPTCEAFLDDDMTHPPTDPTDIQICMRCLHQVFQEEPEVIKDSLTLKIEQINQKLMLNTPRQPELERTHPNLEDQARPIYWEPPVTKVSDLPEDCRPERIKWEDQPVVQIKTCEFCKGTRVMSIVGGVKVKCFCIYDL